MFLGTCTRLPYDEIRICQGVLPYLLQLRPSSRHTPADLTCPLHNYLQVGVSHMHVELVSSVRQIGPHGKFRAPDVDHIAGTTFLSFR